MSNNEVIFFEGKNYQGTAHKYLKDGNFQTTCSDESSSINDKFLSVKVGELLKVLAWQHCNGTGIYREWNKDNPDLSDIGGLSRFKIVDTTDSLVAFRLVDQSGAGIPLSLKCQTFQVGESTDRTDDGNDEYHIIGHLPTDQVGCEPFVTDVKLRQEVDPYEYLSQGAVYFGWDNTENKVKLTYYEETRPPKFKFEQTGAGTFDFIWPST